MGDVSKKQIWAGIVQFFVVLIAWLVYRNTYFGVWRELALTIMIFFPLMAAVFQSDVLHKVPHVAAYFWYYVRNLLFNLALIYFLYVLWTLVKQVMQAFGVAVL